MQYINIRDLDYMNTFFHFSRIDNRNNIEKNGLQVVAGGENEAGNDKENKTIYFSQGISGVLKAVDVWARWEYDKYVSKADHKINYGYQGYDKAVMKEVIFDKLYNDFKCRQYYTLDLIEGKDGDFEYGDIDIKKILSRDKEGRPFLGSLWKYGKFSDWGTAESPNNMQENWNMNIKIGERIISSDRLKIVETENGRTDALSFILESYEKYRPMVLEKYNEMFEILDSFMLYVKDRYINDRDFDEGMPDLGRREVNADEQKKYQRINKINTQLDETGIEIEK